MGQDGFALPEAVYASTAPGWLREIEAVQVLRTAWVQQYHRDGEGVRWREGKDLPPGRLRLSSPYDTDTRYSVNAAVHSGVCSTADRASFGRNPDRGAAERLATSDVETNRYSGMPGLGGH